MGCNTIVGKGKFACKTFPWVREMPVALERVSTLPFQDNCRFLHPLPKYVILRIRSFMSIRPLESTLRLTKLRPGTGSSV